ncbi:MAG: tetratricopeptide repeat protein [Proteobacteria bacterium]|nr:tetratricopeptide repeat protein [Pseudomonadota bacterium]
MVFPLDKTVFPALFPALIVTLVLIGSANASSVPTDNTEYKSAQSEYLSIEVTAVTTGRANNWLEVSLSVWSKDPLLKSVTVSGVAQAGMTIKPSQRVIKMQGGNKGAARFRIHHPVADWRKQKPLVFTVTGDGAHGTYRAQTIVKWPEVAGHGELFHFPDWKWLLMVVSLVLLPLSFRGVRQAIGRSRRQIGDLRFLLDMFVLLVVEVFIISKLDPGSLLTSTTTTGGDTASHFYTLLYLKEVLLPAGLVSGWTPGNYAGFPILQFYFPLDFLFMTLLSGVMSLQVAFKLGSISGILLLPIAAYSMLRLMRCPFPGPGIAAALTLPFLFNSSNSMWGGNILSSLAGEFSFSLSMALSLILIGSLYRGARENRGVIINAVLVFLVGFSHGYTLLFVEAMSIFLLITPHGFFQRLVYLGKVYALAFGLLAFWIVPLLAFTKYTTSYDLVWTINSIMEVFPPILIPSLVVGAAGTIGLLIWSAFGFREARGEALPVIGYLWFGLAMSVVFFVAAPRIGVVDIRYVPYGQLIGTMLAATTLGWLAWNFRKWRVGWVLLLTVLVASVVWTEQQPGPVSTWARWNYEGFEAKSTWPIFEKINAALKGDFNDPRVVFEHSERHNTFGSTRAFESLPLFSGRATLEGLYMQASISAPFVFYIQSEVSQQKSVPFPQYSYSSLNYSRARPRLEMFNVGDLIIRSDFAKQAIREASGYELRDTIGQYELWDLTTNRDRYVEVLEHEPVLFPTSTWKEDAHRWFMEESLLPVHLVFVDEEHAAAFPPFNAYANSMLDLPHIPIDASACSVQEHIDNQQIEIETDCIGKPHIVKMSYHPNWHVEGADKIYLVSPSFMLIYPNQSHVRMYYAGGLWDRIGKALTIAALFILLLNIPLRWKNGLSCWQLVVRRFPLDFSLMPSLGIDPSPRTRLVILTMAVLIGGGGITWGSYVVYHANPNRIFNHAIQLKDQKRFEEAREGFRIAIEELGRSDLAQSAAYYIGITYYLEKKDKLSIAAFEDLVKRYPKSIWIPEAQYHIGLSLLRSGREQEGIARLQELTEKHIGTRWAGYAGDRLKEHKVPEPGTSDPASENVTEMMGMAIDHFNHDRLRQARVLFAKIIEQFPDYEGAPQAVAALALTYYKEGDCASTEQHYRALIDRYPGHRLVPEAWYHLGLCAERSGRAAAAQEYFIRLAKDYPDTVYGKQAGERVRE